MRSIRELIEEEREYIKEENSIVFPAKGARRDCCEAKTWLRLRVQRKRKG